MKPTTDKAKVIWKSIRRQRACSLPPYFSSHLHSPFKQKRNMRHAFQVRSFLPLLNKHAKKKGEEVGGRLAIVCACGDEGACMDAQLKQGWRQIQRRSLGAMPRGHMPPPGSILVMVEVLEASHLVLSCATGASTREGMRARSHCSNCSLLWGEPESDVTASCDIVRSLPQGLTRNNRKMKNGKGTVPGKMRKDMQVFHVHVLELVAVR